MGINLNGHGTLQFNVNDLYISSVNDMDQKHLEVLVNKIIDGFISYEKYWRSDILGIEFVSIPALKYFYDNSLSFLSKNIFKHNVDNFWLKIPVDSHEFYVKNKNSIFNKKISISDLIIKSKNESDLKKNTEIRDQIVELLDKSFYEATNKKDQNNLTEHNKDAYMPTGIDIDYAKTIISDFRKYYLEPGYDYMYRSSDSNDLLTIEVVLLLMKETKDLMIKNHNELETVLYSMPEMYVHDKKYEFERSKHDFIKSLFNDYFEKRIPSANVTVFPRSLKLILKADIDVDYENRTYFLSSDIINGDSHSVLNLKKLLSHKSVSVKASTEAKDDIKKYLSSVSLINKKLETSKIPTKDDKVMYISDFEKLINDMKLLTNSEEPSIDKENSKIILKNYGTNLNSEYIALANKYHLEFEFNPIANFEVSTLKTNLSFLSDLLK